MKHLIRDGVWVTMLTPFTADNQVDYPALEAMVEWYAAAGVDGLFSVCQSSEMFFLTADEREKIGRFVVEKAAGRMQVVVSGHISDGIEDQIAELRRAASCGADAVVLVSNRLAGPEESEEVWKQNAARILEAVPDCDFGIYECPYPYKRLLSPSLLRWCAETGRFSFLKDTSCDLAQIREKLAAVKGTPLKLFNANSATLLPSLQAGASGFCGVMANFHPELYVRLTHRWQQEPETAEILQHFAAVASFIERQDYPHNAKFHMSLCGLPVGMHCRVKPDTTWNLLFETETRELFSLWQDLKKTLPTD
ncbi:MAG: dihydrodipicolinate synthase family protein [Candidatus Merdivicinus sp.]